MRGQGYMFAGAVIVQIMMYLILYSMGNSLWPGRNMGRFFQGLLGSDAGLVLGIRSLKAVENA